MHTLQPYDTTKDLNYITTLALAYIPSDLVNTLELALQSPASRAYNNRDPSTSALMSMINPSFPIRANAPLGGTGGSSDNRGSSYSNPGADGSAFGGSTTPGTKLNNTTIAVSFGVVAGAVVYGAAMVLIARRYKQRKQRHQRSSSLADNDNALARGPLMAGGLLPIDRPSPPFGGRLTPGGGRESRGSRGSGRSGGTSARNQQISAPMMAENSLGWN
jgi:hypothetical protein